MGTTIEEHRTKLNTGKLTESKPYMDRLFKILSECLENNDVKTTD